LNFTRLAEAEASTQRCDCGASAERQLPKQFSIAWKSSSSRDLQPTTTGFESLDESFDRVVGEDARLKWKAIAHRQREKQRVLQRTGATGWDLSRQGDGTYRVMTPEERAASERSRAHHWRVMEHGRKKKLLGG
jgi:hypothetical protein